MSVYLQSGSVLLNGGSIATSSDCCCGGVTGACCFRDGPCTPDVTQTDCENAGGYYRGDGTMCPGINTFCECFPDILTAVTFADVGFTCGCIEVIPGAVWEKVYDTSTSGCGSATGFDGSWPISPDPTPPLPFVQYDNLGEATFPITSFDAFLDACISDPFTSDCDSPTIYAGCVAENDLYMGSPPGWFLWVFSNTTLLTYFYAEGVTNPFAPFMNQNVCGVAPPINSSYIAGTAGGTAVFT